jgi:hypothetical protein
MAARGLMATMALYRKPVAARIEASTRRLPQYGRRMTNFDRLFPAWLFSG